MYIITFHKYYQSRNFWTNLVSVRGGVKRNVKLCKEKGKETRHSESKLRHGSQHVERVAPHIELKLKMGHQPFFLHILKLYLTTSKFRWCLQFLAPAGSTKAFPQVLHACSFVPLCLFMCTTSPLFWTNCFPHFSQLNSLTPVCTFSWRIRTLVKRNLFEQPVSLQVCFLSPVCFPMCSSRLYLL